MNSIVVRFAEALPTSSATIEQSFSVIKLVKTDRRNRLQELSLEGLILIGQEFRIKSPESIINERIIELATPVIKRFIAKKKTIFKKCNEENKTQGEEEKFDELDPARR